MTPEDKIRACIDEQDEWQRLHSRHSALHASPRHDLASSLPTEAPQDRPVNGGQGREADDLDGDARAILWTVGLAIALWGVVLAGIWWVY